MGVYLCPNCSKEELDIELVGEPFYDEFFDETYSSFIAVCRFCGWKK